MLARDLIVRALAGYPEEVCGLISGLDGRATDLYPVENMLHSPVAYKMEPLEQVRVMSAIEADGKELLAIYHSHPNGPARPSESDVALSLYPDQVYIIISLADPQRPDTVAFTIRDGLVEQVALLIE